MGKAIQLIYPIYSKINKAMGSFRKRFLLKNKSFTIISNNCFGGWVYRRYNLPYQSPMAGLFIMADDYLKMLKDLRGYMISELRFIDPNDSKWKNELIKYCDKVGQYPIGVLKDIEIHFIHYINKEEAYEKWTRRAARINWDYLIVKFCDQNLCTEKHIREFYQLDYPNKICFAVKPVDGISDLIVLKEDSHLPYVQNETRYCSRYLDVTRYLNRLKKTGSAI